jgi:tRNA threonylcarbamoyladenosine biosynthesis protein TsaB
MSRAFQNVIAIEAAIAGGSISLLRDGRETANWIGEADMLKAENLLVNIDRLLLDNGVDLREIDLVAVSAGPGSFTGIRVGIATALGLKNGLNIEMSSISALDAMACKSQVHTKRLTAAVPVGRNAVCVEEFDLSDESPRSISGPTAIPQEELMELVGMEPTVSYVLHEFLYAACNPSDATINFGKNIAAAIGLVCSTRPVVVTDPLFISKGF